jgi:hypothetical protein
MPTVVRAGWVNSTREKSSSIGNLDKDLDRTNISTSNFTNELDNTSSYLENLESVEEKSSDNNPVTNTSDREDNSHEIETVFEDNKTATEENGEEYKYSTKVEENAENNFDRSNFEVDRQGM